MLAIVIPGVYWLGRAAHRLDAVERLVNDIGGKVDRNMNTLQIAVESLRRELLSEMRHTHHTPIVRTPPTSEADGS